MRKKVAETGKNQDLPFVNIHWHVVNNVYRRVSNPATRMGMVLEKEESRTEATELGLWSTEATGIKIFFSL